MVIGQPSEQLFPNRWPLSNPNRTKIVNTRKVKRRRNSDSKNLKNLLLQNQNSFDLETWHAALGLKFYKVCINDDPLLTLTYFTARSKSKCFSLGCSGLLLKFK